MAIVTEVLLWLHIVAAIGWVGAAMVFGMIIGPSMPTFTPTTRSEFVLKVLPKYVSYVEVFILATPLIGIALALSISNGSFSVFSPSTRFGMVISVGVGLVVVAWVIAFGAVTPAAQLQTAAKTMRIGAAVGNRTDGDPHLHGRGMTTTKRTESPLSLAGQVS